MIKLFTMKISEEDLQKYKAKAAALDLSLAKLIRDKLDGVEIPKKYVSKKRRKIPKADPELIRQVAAIGNNLNQISRRVNQGEKFEIIPHLIGIEDQLEQLLDAPEVH